MRNFGRSLQAFFHDSALPYLRVLVSRRADSEATRWLFLRLLGAVYIAAFASLLPQVRGLFGPRGIAPAAAMFDGAPLDLLGSPTVFWLGAGDGALLAAAWAGIAAALLLVLDLAPALAALACWALYLSFVTIGDEFLPLQWDALLLEAGLLAVFFAPWRLWRRPAAGDPGPPGPAVFLLRWLLFRLVFASGVVKLASARPEWRALTAIDFHYWTQPLPNPVAWYAHRLPVGFAKAAAAAVLALETAAPLLIFGPRRARAAACAALLFLQAAIAATGNFGFFNLLSAALCVPLLDDAMLPALLRARLAGRPAGLETGPTEPAAARVQRFALAPIAVLLLALSLVPVASLAWDAGLPVRLPAPLFALWRAAAPFRPVGGYGLFANMTIERPEIVIEGSADGETWLEYEFPWKPGDPRRRPPITGLHMPRLDWQMWFAALHGYRRTPWFDGFLARLLEGSPEVLALLERNPFPDAPPRYVHAVLYEYRFSDGADGTWWRREWRALYCPVFARR